MNCRTASVVPLIALPRTSFSASGRGGLCARPPAASTDAAAIDAAVPRPTSPRNSLRFNRILHPRGSRTTSCHRRLRGGQVFGEDPDHARPSGRHGDKTDLLLIDVILQGRGLDFA